MLYETPNGVTYALVSIEMIRDFCKEAFEKGKQEGIKEERERNGKLFRVVHKDGRPWTGTELVDYMRRVDTDVTEDTDVSEENRFQFHINERGEIFISNGYETMSIIEDSDDFILSMKKDEKELQDIMRRYARLLFKAHQKGREEAYRNVVMDWLFSEDEENKE